MTVEILPVGIACNIACGYCYQHPQRDAGNIRNRYDLDKIKKTAEKMGQPFALFGGEPLLMPIEDLEELFKFGYERFKCSSIQTNGTLIRDAHINLFKRYNVSVGISIDGPDKLNGARWAGSNERTAEMTQATMAAIERLCAHGIFPGLIVTLTKANASPNRLPQLKDWFKYLDSLGITSSRLHLLEMDTQVAYVLYSLSENDCLNALIELFEMQKELRHLRFDLFKDICNLLMGHDDASCIFNACDPLTTPAVQAIGPQGELHNCGRIAKDGVDMVKANVTGKERYLMLYQTPYEDGGCKGCRFWMMCKGQCPGTAIDGDWRNRTMHCRIWMGIMTYIELDLLKQGKHPLSLDITKRTAAEQRFFDECNKTYHTGHGDAPHGDSHGDSHGDHYDEKHL